LTKHMEYETKAESKREKKMRVVDMLCSLFNLPIADDLITCRWQHRRKFQS